MSRLEELISELCPNGVEYKKLSDVLISIHSGHIPVSLVIFWYVFLGIKSFGRGYDLFTINIPSIYVAPSIISNLLFSLDSTSFTWFLFIYTPIKIIPKTASSL